MGKKFWQKYSPNEYPLVLSDIQMPGISGNELAAAIKQNAGQLADQILFFLPDMPI